MKAMAIVQMYTDEENRGRPITAQTIPSWVHLGPSRTGDYQSYKIAASPATLDALEAEATCVLVVRFADTDEDGTPTYAELNLRNDNMRNAFNGFAKAKKLREFPVGTTPRGVLNAFGVEPEGYDIHDPS